MKSYNERRLQVRLSQEASDALDILKQQTGGSPTTIINNLLTESQELQENTDEELQQLP